MRKKIKIIGGEAIDPYKKSSSRKGPKIKNRKRYDPTPGKGGRPKNPKGPRSGNLYY